MYDTPPMLTFKIHSYFNVVCSCCKVQVAEVIYSADSPHRWRVHPVSYPVDKHMIGGHLPSELLGQLPLQHSMLYFHIHYT